MAYAYKIVYNRTTIASTGAAVQAKFAEIATAITSANSNWSLTQNQIYDSTFVCMVLTHSGGAQIAFHYGSGVINANNCYAGSTTNAGALRIAYNPSSNGTTWATVSDTVNPKDTSTWCSDAGSYLFQRMYLRNEAGITLVTAGWSLRFVLDTSTANIWIASVAQEVAPFDMMDKLAIFLDDHASALNFTQMANPADTKKSLLSIISLTPFTNIHGGGIEIQFFDSGGTRIEGAVFSHRNKPLFWEFADLSASGVHDLESVIVTKATTGRKGLLDYRALCLLRVDAMPNQIIKVGNLYFLSLSGGICIPWEVSFGQMR